MELEKRFLVPSFLQTALSLGLGQDQDQRSGVILFITLLPNNAGWQFQWPAMGDPFYRVVLRGEQIGTVVDTTHGMQTFVYNGSGFIDYPPPLEIMPSSLGLAASEIDPPFIVIQWYGNPVYSYYQVQEMLGVWATRFQISEVGATIYSWTTPVLADGSSHQYQVIGFNTLNQVSSGLAFNIDPVVTPFDFVETEYAVTYDDTGHNIVLSLAP